MLANNNAYAEFVKSQSFRSPAPLNVTPRPDSNPSQSSSAIVGDEEVVQLKKKIKTLEQELERKKSVEDIMSNYSNEFIKSLDQFFEQKINKVMNDKMEQYNRQQLEKLENFLSEFKQNDQRLKRVESWLETLP